VTEETLSVNGVRTHVLRGGEGPPLVYLHGAAPAGEWLPLHRRLAQRFAVYAPDHPGFGFSERPDWITTMEDVVLHYEELLCAVGPEKPAVVGFSFGGWIAAELAVYYPDRVGALVLLNAGGLHLDGHLIPDLLGLEAKELSRLVFQDPACAVAYFASQRSPEQRVRHARGMATLALLAWNPWFDPKLRGRLRRVTAPTLALWAEHDRLIPPVYGEAFRDAIPGAAFELLPDCGHMAPLERPDAVAEAIAAFLERHA
jgi:pimeloyl-ACP methyl ester carboxylesterase